MSDRQQQYYDALRQPFTKILRLRFLNPDGTTAFAVSNDPRDNKTPAMIADGNISCNLQNGTRRTASVTFDNITHDFDYAVSHIWFGTEIAWDEGLILADGTPYYLPQGVFLLTEPEDVIEDGNRIIRYNLTDKWAYLDGTLGGYLESTYEAAVGVNVFAPIAALLAEDRGNGQPIDNVTPVFTDYYNGMTQELPDGTTVAMTDTPYTLTVNGDSGTLANVITGFTGMLNAWVGYDETGALRVDPSQDDILDDQKPISWRFGADDVTLVSATYKAKNSAVYNDYIVLGEMLDNNHQPSGRAQNLDPSSPTNINIIGRKTYRESAADYATDTQCQDLAVWRLKRSAALQNEVTISCAQMFHIRENEIITVARTDKPGSPVERHLVMGFARPVAPDQPMTINAVSVQDFPTATVTSWIAP